MTLASSPASSRTPAAAPASASATSQTMDPPLVKLSEITWADLLPASKVPRAIRPDRPNIGSHWDLMYQKHYELPDERRFLSPDEADRRKRAQLWICIQKASQGPPAPPRQHRKPAGLPLAQAPARLLTMRPSAPHPNCLRRQPMQKLPCPRALNQDQGPSLLGQLITKHPILEPVPITPWTSKVLPLTLPNISNWVVIPARRLNWDPSGKLHLSPASPFLLPPLLCPEITAPLGPYGKVWDPNHNQGLTSIQGLHLLPKIEPTRMPTGSAPTQIPS